MHGRHIYTGLYDIIKAENLVLDFTLRSKIVSSLYTITKELHLLYTTDFYRK
jgi:hypothetical protein